jgi:hypothetical protein
MVDRELGCAPGMQRRLFASHLLLGAGLTRCKMSFLSWLWSYVISFRFSVAGSRATLEWLVGVGRLMKSPPAGTMDGAPSSRPSSSSSPLSVVSRLSSALVLRWRVVALLWNGCQFALAWWRRRALAWRRSHTLARPRSGGQFAHYTTGNRPFTVSRNLRREPKYPLSAWELFAESTKNRSRRRNDTRCMYPSPSR